MKMRVCPFCGDEIKDEDWDACCGEIGHSEVIDVCEECWDELKDGKCPTCSQIKQYENDLNAMEASCQI